MCDTEKNISFVNDIVSRNIDYSGLKDEITSLSNELEKEIEIQNELIKQKATDSTMSDIEFNTLYKQKRDNIKVINDKISAHKQELSNQIITKARLENIQDFLTKEKAQIESRMIKGFYKGIFVTSTNDLIMVYDESDVTLDELILNRAKYLKTVKTIISKTHFDEALNKNIYYKVVTINEQ